MGILYPFLEEERMLASTEHEVDRKSELCKPEPFAVRALGTALMIAYVRVWKGWHVS